MVQLPDIAEAPQANPSPEVVQNNLEESIKKRVAKFDYYYDIRTFSYRLRKSAKQKKQKIKTGKYAIVLKRQIDSRGQYQGTVIEIQSPALCEVLLDINKDVEDIELSRNEPEISESQMYYSYPSLCQRLEAEQGKEELDETLILDIRAAIFYVEEHQGNVLKDVIKMTSQNEISWDLVWALFFPNSLVYSYHSPTEQETVLIVRQSAYKTKEDRSRYFAVICDMIHDDGRNFGYARCTFAINEYRGTRAITSLEVFPLKYHTDVSGVYSRAVTLGKKFVSLPTHSYHEISGQGFRGGRDRDQIFVDGRIMVTPFAYYRNSNGYNPHVHEAISKFDLTDDQYAICTPIVLGFAFDRKTWGAFPLTRLRDVDWNDAAFDMLVLGEKQKKLIYALVRQHVEEGKGFDDIIKNKGRGLIGLFAGTPGCGKTLTAEAVAEVTHKPLYALSAGELGIRPGELEDKLLNVLELAQMWDAVLLLDEAEVFLTQRSVTDLNRNALVSIFLRQLEYYQGILILTTNMPEHCDRAFESRIHFSVSYPELDVDARKKIWRMFLERASVSISEGEVCRLAEHRINGRQIKNAFSSALTIFHANDSQERTLLDDIDVVLSVVSDWKAATSKGLTAD